MRHNLMTSAVGDCWSGLCLQRAHLKVCNPDFQTTDLNSEVNNSRTSVWGWVMVSDNSVISSMGQQLSISFFTGLFRSILLKLQKALLAYMHCDLFTMLIIS